MIRFFSDNPFKGSDVGRSSAPTFVDLDGDGDLDAVVGNSDGTISYFRNAGTRKKPQFQLTTNNQNPFAAIDVGSYSKPSLVDIDKDGDLDAFIGNSSGTIAYFRNSGSKRRPVFVEATVNPLSNLDVGSNSEPNFVDIDGDGDLDAFIGNGDGTINYLKNGGTNKRPNFQQQTGRQNPLNDIDVSRDSTLAFVDIDGDRDFDALIGSNSGTVQLYQNLGSRTVPKFAPMLGSANPLFAVGFDFDSSPELVDIDKDGDLDAFIGNNSGTIDFLKNVGNQKQPYFNTNPFYGQDLGVGSVTAIADIDGDGDLDVLAGNTEGKVLLFENVGSKKRPSFSQANIARNPLPLDVDGEAVPALLDIDGDKDLDAFIGNRDGIFNFFENTSNKKKVRFAQSPDNPLEDLDVGTGSAPVFIDIDGDGDFDGFSGNSDGNVIFFKNTGSAKRPEFVEIGGSRNPFNGVNVGSWSKIAFVDADGDRDLDAFIGSTNGTIRFFERTGTKNQPNFTERTGAKNPFDTFDIGNYSVPAFGDLDGDGDADALVGAGDGTIYFYENTAPTAKRNQRSRQTRSASDFLLNPGGDVESINIDDFLIESLSVSGQTSSPLPEASGGLDVELAADTEDVDIFNLSKDDGISLRTNWQQM